MVFFFIPQRFSRQTTQLLEKPSGIRLVSPGSLLPGPTLVSVFQLMHFQDSVDDSEESFSFFDDIDDQETGSLRNGETSQSTKRDLIMVLFIFYLLLPLISGL